MIEHPPNNVELFPPAPKELTVAEAALLDLRRQEDAIAARAMALGQADPTLEEITEFDRQTFGTATRFEIDVCVPIADLKREISTIRAELANCLATLEQRTGGNVRRHMVHSRLVMLRAHLRRERQERKVREAR